MSDECDNQGHYALALAIFKNGLQCLAYEIRHNAPAEATEEVRSGTALALCLLVHSHGFRPDLGFYVRRATELAKRTVSKPVHVILAFHSNAWHTPEQRLAYNAKKVEARLKRLSKKAEQPQLENTTV